MEKSMDLMEHLYLMGHRNGLIPVIPFKYSMGRILFKHNKAVIIFENNKAVAIFE